MGEDDRQTKVEIQAGFVEENLRIKASKKIHPRIYLGVLPSSH